MIELLLIAAPFYFEPAADVAIVVAPGARVSREEADSARDLLERALEANDVVPARLLSVTAREGVIGCGEENQFLCWARAIEAPSASTPRVLVMLGLHESGPTSRRFTGVALDVGRAKAIIAKEAAWGLPDDKLDTKIFEGAVVPVEIDRASETPPGDALLAAIRPWVPARAAKAGALLVRGVEIGAEVKIDGRAVPHAAQIRSVIAGERILTIHRENSEISRRTVTIAPGVPTEIDLGAREVPAQIVLTTPLVTPEASPLRALNFYGGAALVILGAAALITSPLFADDRAELELCTAGRCDPGGGNFAGTGTGSGGILVAPFGYSLALAGSTMFLGELAVDGGESWIPLAAGVVLGAVAYGVSAAVSAP